MKPRLGLCSVTFRALPPDEVISLATAAGVTGVEWGGDVHVQSRQDARAVREQCAGAGLEIPSYGSYLRAGCGRRDEVQPTMDIAAELGARNVRVWCDWTGPDPNAATWQRIVDDLQAMADAAADRGLTVSIEFHDFTVTERAESAVRLVTGVDRPNVFSYWQPVHGLDVPRWLAEFAVVLPYLSHLHVFFHPDLHTRGTLSTGAALWQPVLASCVRAPENGWHAPRYAFLEFVMNDSPERFAADAAVLGKWLATA